MLSQVLSSYIRLANVRSVYGSLVRLGQVSSCYFRLVDVTLGQVRPFYFRLSGKLRLSQVKSSCQVWSR